MPAASREGPNAWPALPAQAWVESLETLHMWTQIVGKVRLAQSPWVNHSLHVTLYANARGLGTSPIPHGERIFEIDFDFIDHALRISTDDGRVRSLALEPQTTADFHARLMTTLDDLGLTVKIHGRPNEVEEAIPFAEDRTHAAYDAAAVQRFWRALSQVDRVLKAFRARFIGKVSPVHFFWGSFDHAVTRFSGRTAPEHPGGFPNMPDRITREAYSHEVSSAGFWPGGRSGEAFFYSYAYPTPGGFADAAPRPEAASWNPELGEFVLPYESVRTAASPDGALMAFLESTYDAAARCAGWDREAFEQRFVP